MPQRPATPPSPAANVRPRIFISAVTDEFRTARGKAADVLEFLGYEAVKQEIFGTEPGDLRQMLRDKIDSCEGLLQLVGRGYGAEPPAGDGEFGRVSYTQFEFLHARARGKKTWLLCAGESARRDTPAARLDWPRAPAPPDPAAWQAERRARQADYVAARQTDGHVRWSFGSDTELENAVLKLRNDSEELRQEFRQWQGTVLRRFDDLGDRLDTGHARVRRGVVAAAVALALLGAGGLWWAGRAQKTELAGLKDSLSKPPAFEYVTAHDGAGTPLLPEPDFKLYTDGILNPPGGRIINGTGIRVLQSRTLQAMPQFPTTLPWVEIEVLEGPDKGRRGWTIQKNIKKPAR